MPTTDHPFATRDRRRIYEYVERHGPVPPDALYEDGVVQVDPGRYRQLVAIMRRDGYLRVVDGRLEAALDRGVSEEHRGEEIEFSIRPARDEDVSGIIGVVRQVTAGGTYVEAETVAQQLRSDDALIRHDESESRRFFVATVDGEVVGWAELTVPEQEKLAHTAELTVGVLEELRGRGIGSHLMQRGLSWAKSRGLLKVYNSVPSTNRGAISFLKAHGWTVEAVRRDHYLVDGQPVDEVMLAVEL